MSADVFYLNLREEPAGGGLRLQSEMRQRGPGFTTRPAPRNVLYGRDRLIFIAHGYANDQQDAVVRWTRFADAVVASEASLQSDAFVVVLWPGDSARIGHLCYPFIEDNARRSAIELAWIVGQDGDGVSERFVSATARKDFVAMSYGAHVVCQALSQLHVQNGKSMNGGVCCLLAAAIDASSLANPYAFQAATDAAHTTHIAWSSDDSALGGSRPIGDLLSAIIGLGGAILSQPDQAKLLAQQVEKALGLCGPRDFLDHLWNRSVVHPEEWAGYDHRDYEPPTDPNVPLNDRQKLAAARVAAWLI